MPFRRRSRRIPPPSHPVFNQFGTEFDTRTRRLIAEGGFEYLPSSALTVTAKLRRTDREGTIPFGGSFGHSSLVELPAPTDHRLTEADAGAEFVRDPLLLRAAYTGSFFHNDVTSVVFDNPFRAIDSASASSRGRLTLAPTNSYNGVNGLASVKLPHRSRASAFVSVGTAHRRRRSDRASDDQFGAAAGAARARHGERRGADDGGQPHLCLPADPLRRLHGRLSAIRLRQSDARIRDDAAGVLRQRRLRRESGRSIPSRSACCGTPLDADLKLTPMSGISAGVGFTRLGEERTHRIFESTTDNVVRVTFDTVSNQRFTLRTKYEHAERRGVGIEEGERELAAIGEQPGMRHFDIAARNRNRVTILGSVMPAANVGVSLSVAAGKDDYLESLFGLRDNTHRVYGAGVDVTPTERVVLGTSYSYERYNALSRSRQANPGVQFTDPSRNWATDATDRAHSWLMNAEIGRIADKVDLRFSYDFSRARARYEYITGPVRGSHPARRGGRSHDVADARGAASDLERAAARHHGRHLRAGVAPVARPVLLVRTVPRERLHARCGRQSRSGPRTGAVDGISLPPVHGEHGVGAPDLSVVSVVRPARGLVLTCPSRAPVQ